MDYPLRVTVSPGHTPKPNLFLRHQTDQCRYDYADWSVIISCSMSDTFEKVLEKHSPSDIT